MKSLLSKQDRRQLEFLDLLMCYPSVSLNQVKACTDYPIRTLSSDIRQINEYIKPAQVITSNGGVRLEIPPEISARHIYTVILRRSREFKLLTYIFFNESRKQDEIAGEFFLSISTLRRMIASLNEGLKKREIAISSAPYMIEGDEAAINVLFFSIFSETDPTLKDIMSPKEKQMIALLCKKMTAEGHIQFNYPRLIRLYLWIFVRLIRIRNGHHINASNDDIKRFRTEITQDEVFCREFQETFKIDLDQQLIFELFYLFLRFGYAKSHEDLQNIVSQSALHMLLYYKIQTLLDTIGRDLKFPLTDTRPLALELFNILQFSERPPNVLYNRSRIFSRGFARENVLTSVIIRRHISAAFDIAADPEIHDLIFYLLVTHWPGLINKLRNSMLEVVVGILFDSDIEHAEFIADLIVRMSQRRLRMVLPSRNELVSLESLYNGVDLLITNIPELIFNCSKVICIAAYPSLADQERIAIEIERIYLEKWRQSTAGRI